MFPTTNWSLIPAPARHGLPSTVWQSAMLGPAWPTCTKAPHVGATTPDWDFSIVQRFYLPESVDDPSFSCSQGGGWSSTLVWLFLSWPVALPSPHLPSKTSIFYAGPLRIAIRHHSWCTEFKTTKTKLYWPHYLSVNIICTHVSNLFKTQYISLSAPSEAS